jgi:hypothetical protein
LGDFRRVTTREPTEKQVQEWHVLSKYEMTKMRSAAARSFIANAHNVLIGA